MLLAALNPRMLRLAGELADGVILAWTPETELSEQVDMVRQGAVQAGRDPSAIHIVAVAHAYAGDEPERAREVMRRHIVGYATVATHRARFARVISNLDEVEAKWRRGDRRGAAALINDEVLDAYCAIGDAAAIARLDAFRARGVDMPVLLTVSTCPDDVAGPRSTLRTVAALLDARR